MLKNYCPVSNIPVTAQIMEKVVLEQLNNLLEINHLHDRYQSAYRRNHSTGLAQDPDGYPESTEPGITCHTAVERSFRSF
jgi:hypothetical protein